MFVTLRYGSHANGEEEKLLPRRNVDFDEALISMENYSESYNSFAPRICLPNDPAIEDKWVESSRIVCDRLSLLKETYKAIQAAKRRLQASRPDDPFTKPITANNSSPDLDDNEPTPDPNADHGQAHAKSTSEDSDEIPQRDIELVGLSYTAQDIDSNTLANLLQRQVGTSDQEARSSPTPQIDLNLLAYAAFDFDN